MGLRTCVSPNGRFVWAVHKPDYRVTNLRRENCFGVLGAFTDGRPIDNHVNFPPASVDVSAGDWIFEIANPFPFRGATFIKKQWAAEKQVNPDLIRLPPAPEVSYSRWLKERGSFDDRDSRTQAFVELPEPVLLALAATSTDADDLVILARLSCRFVFGEDPDQPAGLRFRRNDRNRPEPDLVRPELFEVLVNNRHLPDPYKEVMVLRPGVQGGSEIVGDWRKVDENSHVFEYLRRNSYIPWGHFAANMANDSIRYRLEDLSPADMTGLRHLYYQRTFVRLADQLGLKPPRPRERLSVDELEECRCRVLEQLQTAKRDALPLFDSTLWGWNYGFDYAPSGFRLHASHQQIHQQYALIPSAFGSAASAAGEPIAGFESAPYACGDLVADFIERYREQTGKRFFEQYLQAIRCNQRMDGGDEAESSLIVFETESVMVFVPKAQTSQWELQVITQKPVGNILEADRKTRAALDRSLLVAVRVLSAMGARMITSIEFSKRIGADDSDQRLLYSILPRLPQSPGAFSEVQLRWINGHYPEDFARACRRRLPSVLKSMDETDSGAGLEKGLA